jgi:NAD(P)H-dependent flavin oxidoreductase YrpB (nitropropane dioxygenase family)
VIALGIPVYVAGAFLRGGTREDMAHWTARGAYGMQVGSRFALCRESGMREDLKARVIADNAVLETRVLTDSILSPTGYPFKIVPLAGTLSEPEVYAARKRICNRGYLVSSRWETLPDGTRRESYICPAMPEAQYVKLGGDPADITDRVCLCNALLATADYAPDGEPPLVTLGESGVAADRLLSAREIVEDILGKDYVAAKERELVLA